MRRWSTTPDNKYKQPKRKQYSGLVHQKKWRKLMVKKMTKKTATKTAPKTAPKATKSGLVRQHRVNGVELDRAIHTLRPESTKEDCSGCETNSWNPIQSVGAYGTPINPTQYEANMRKQMVSLFKKGRSVLEIASTMYHVRDCLDQNYPGYEKYLNKVAGMIQEELEKEGRNVAPDSGLNVA